MSKAFKVQDVHLLNNLREPFKRFLNPEKRERARDRRAGMSPRQLERIRAICQCTTCYETKGIHAHHLMSGAARMERGIGLKAVDKRTVPLCWRCHGELHRYGSRREGDWFQRRGFNPYVLADALWRQSSDRDHEQSIDNMKAVLHRFKLEAIHTVALREQDQRAVERGRR